MDQSEDDSKVRANLMKEYGIEFEGRILPEKWGEYTTIFEDIRHIGKLRPEEFIRMFHADDEYVYNKRVKASKLVEEAWNCLKIMDSEYGWRKEVEFRAFSPFEEEIICHICLKRRWMPKFKAEPTDPKEAERLQRRRKRRLMCGCTLLQQVGPNVDDQYSRMFTRELDKQVEHQDMLEHSKKILKRQRPDCIIGLGITRTLRHYLSSISRNKYCPFRRSNLVYPFMVIETKQAENNDATFGSILRQKAFVIRTCLRLQQNLQEDTGIPHQCIVWSFAIIGEEWRLYAAVPDGSKTKIFDLWHGSVLFPEGSLQLLLIIDYLCDWASDVYRMSVINCLTGGGQNPLNTRLSPSGTDTSSLAGDADLRALRAMSHPSRSSLIRELSGGETASYSPPEFPQIEPLIQIGPTELLDRGDIYAWQRWTTAEQNPWPWARKATIRHSNRVELSSVQVTVPEDLYLLNACLNSLFPTLSAKDSARKVLISLEDDNLAVTTSVKASSWQGSQLKESILEIRALVFFTSRLRSQDWQIVRQVLCILCSERAIQFMAKIAELRPTIRTSPNGSGVAQCERFLQAINSLNLVGGTRSVGLALTRCQLSLRSLIDRTGSLTLEWREFISQKGDGVTRGELRRILSDVLQGQEEPIPDLLTPYVKKKSYLYNVPVGSDQQELPVTGFKMPSFKTQGIVIKKPMDSSLETTQDFCFLIIDENIWFDDEAKLGRLLEESHRAKEWFSTSKTNATYDGAERAFIHKWVQILKSQLPQDILVE